MLLFCCRKVDRINDENDSLVQQVQELQEERKLNQQTIIDQNKKIKDFELKLVKLEEKGMKCMELEASIICLKESEKCLKEKNVKMESALNAETQKLKSVKEAIQIEKKLSADKNDQVKLLSDQLASANQNVTEQPNKVVELEEMIARLKDDNQKIEATIDQLNIDVGHKDKCIREHQTTNEELIAELNELNTELKKRGEKIANIEDQESSKAKEAIKKLQAKTEEFDQLNADNIEIKKTLTRKEKMLDDWKKVADSKQEVYVELAEKDKELNDTVEELNNANTELQNLKTTIQLKDQEIAHFKKLGESKVVLTEALEKINKYEHDLEENANVKTELRSRIDELEMLNHESEEMIRSQTKEISSLDQELVNVRSNNGELKEKIKTLDKLFKEANAEFTELLKGSEDKMKTLEGELELKIEKIRSLENEVGKADADTKIKLEEINAILEQGKEENRSLRQQLDEQENDNSESSELNSESSELKIQLNHLRSDKETRDQQLKECHDMIENLKQESEKLDKIWQKKLETTEHELVSSKQELKGIGQENSKKIDDLSKSNAELEASIKSKDEEIKDLKSNLVEKDYEIQEKTNALAQEANLKDEISEQLDVKNNDLQSCQAKVDNLTKEINVKSKAADDRVGNVKKELTEELDCKIKELEKSNAKISELEASLNVAMEKCITAEGDLTTQIKDNDNEIKDFKIKVNDLTKEVEDLRQQLANTSIGVANTSLLSEHEDSRSEVMSTSTYVSRAEEVSRMRDLEDTFEDRYGKLKLIALKYKKKMAEQSKTIEELQKSLVAVKTKASTQEDTTPAFDSLRDKLSTMTRNFNSVQKQYDLAQDKVEDLEKKVKTLTKDLETMVAENVTLKEGSAEASQQLAEAQAEIDRLKEVVKVHEKELQSQKVMIEEETKERKCLDLQVQAFKSMENDLKGKSTELDMVGNTVSSLKLEVEELEAAKSHEQQRADHAQELLTNARNQLIQAETDLMKKSEELDEINRKYEQSNSYLEETKQELANNLSRTESSATEGRTRVNQMERQIFALESSFKAKTVEVKEKENELEEIKKEFDTYKVRAQSVLKQAKDAKDENNKNKAQDEVKAMEKVVDMLKDKLKTSLEENKTVKVETNRLQEDHDRLMERHSLLLQEIASKEKSWRSKLEAADARTKEQEKMVETGVDSVHKEIEDLRQKHDQELQVLRTQHSTETTKFKTQIDVAENEIVRLEFVLQKEQEARKQAEETYAASNSSGYNYNNSGYNSGSGIMHSNMERLDISQIEREAAEGQEVDSYSQPIASLTSPLPLDQLLAQSGATGYMEPEVSRSTASSRQGDRQLAGSRQAGAERQLSHLSALLSESEAQNERLEKLTEVLKEEIRTYQRSEERHKHIENLEYIKNIILKFLTLAGEERARLIPVLSTILRLSKEEVASIQQIAKVEEEAAAAGGDSWGSYLHLWSTP